MTDGYRVPFADVETEFTEMRSRCITYLCRVESEEVGLARIEDVRL